MKTDPSQSDELLLMYNSARMFLAEEEEEEARIVVSVLDVTDRRRDEEALRESEEKYQSLVEASRDFIFVIGRDDRVQFVNQTAAAKVGLSPQEVIGRPRTELFPPDVAEQQAAGLRGVFDTGRHFADESRIVYGGHEAWQSNILVPIHDKSGNVTAVMGVSRDITESKLAEETIRESEERFRSFVDNTFVGIYRTTPDGRILMANPALVSMLGYNSFDDLAGRNLEQEGYEPGYDRSEFKLLMEQGDQLIGYESPWKRKDGSVILVQENARCVRGPAGEVLFYEGTIEDISERRKAEEALKQSEKDYKDLFNNATDAIYIQDKEGRFLDVNQGAVDMYGYPKEFFMGKTPGFLSAPGKNDMKKIIGFVEDAFNGKPSQYDFWGIRKNGEVFPKIVRSQQGFYLGRKVIITCAIDITERKRAEEQIKDSLREKEVMLKEIHHRVKNNLQIIASLLNLQTGYVTDEKYKRMFLESQNRVRSMALVHEKLYKSKDLAGINFSEYVNGLMIDLYSSYGVTQGDVELSVDITIQKLPIDIAIPCGLLINELVSNSFKYAFKNSKGKGKIGISLGRDDSGTYTLEVSDNGPGISKDLDLKTAPTLGLQLVDALVSQLDASIKITGKGGARVTIKFKV